MGRMFAAAAVVALFVAWPAMAAHRPRHPVTITNPDWAYKPTGLEMAAHYPDRAQRYSLGGRAEMRCAVEANGTLTHCAIVAEEPLGFGFGAAALEMAPFFKMKPKTINGRAVDGAVVNVPINYVVPPMPNASPPGPGGKP